MSKAFMVSLWVTVVGLCLVIGFVLGLWADSGSDRIEYRVTDIESKRDISTKACVDNGGVPTYSAWDGGLNGCIQVGQSHRDTNVEIKR